MEGEDIIEVEYCMSELVDTALTQRKNHLTLTLMQSMCTHLPIQQVEVRPPTWEREYLP